MNDTGTTTSEEMAVLRKEQQLQGQPITHAQAFLEAWKQVSTSTITEFNQLISDPTGTEAQKKKDAEYTAAAVAQREADAHYAQSFKTLKSITLEDYARDWEGTFEKYIEASKNAWEKYDKGFATDTDKKIMIDGAVCTHTSCNGDPERIERFRKESPRDFALVQELRRDLIRNGTLKEGMSWQQETLLLKKAAEGLDPQERNNLLKASERILPAKELERYNNANKEVGEIIRDNLSNEMAAARKEPNLEKRGEMLDAVYQKAYAQMKNPDDAKFLNEKNAALKGDAELVDLYKSVSANITKSIASSDAVATKITDVDRGQVINDIEHNGGRLKPETLDKVLPQMLSELKKIDPTMTEAKLREMEKNDPKGFAEALKGSINILDNKAEATKSEYTFNFTSFFSKPATPPMMTPIEQAPAGVVPAKNPPDGLPADVLAKVDAIKAQQENPQAPKTEETTPPAPTNPFLMAQAAQNTTEATRTV